MTARQCSTINQLTTHARLFTRPRLTAAVVLAASMLSLGCGGGLSSRDNGTAAPRAMSSIDLGTPRSAPVTLPVQLAVAQVGEIAPPDELLTRLSAESTVVARAAPIPWPMRDQPRYEYRGFYPQPNPSTPLDEVKLLTERARALGFTHLLVIGGTLDSSVSDTALNVFDLTIIGMFVVPSREVRVRGEALGGIIDTATGSLVAQVIAKANERDLAPMVVAYDQIETTAYKLEKPLSRDMATQVIEQLKRLDAAARVAAAPASPAAPPVVTGTAP